MGEEWMETIWEALVEEGTEDLIMEEVVDEGVGLEEALGEVDAREDEDKVGVDTITITILMAEGIRPNTIRAPRLIKLQNLRVKVNLLLKIEVL
jgi:hypothetical protein